jgi:hypothetical protein
MISLDVDAPEEDGGVPLVGYRVEYKNKQIYDVAVGTSTFVCLRSISV